MAIAYDKQYSPVIRYPGSKWKIAKQIVGYMPEHRSYLEPYFGSGAVLFNKPQSPIETVNDLDDRVYSLFRIVRDEPAKLANLVQMTPFSRTEYEGTFNNKKEAVSELELVRRFLIQCWQGYGFRTNGYKVGWKNDVQGREAAYAVHNWNRLPNWIMDATERLKQVQITKESAIDLIKRFNYENVLIYADPPYLLETRAGKQYRHEMTKADHIELLETLREHKGLAMVSGYDSDLYNQVLHDWYKVEFNTTAEKGAKRKDILWMNFEPIEQMTFWE